MQKKRISRRNFVQLGIASLSMADVLGLNSRVAFAQTAYPNKPVHLVIPFPPGGFTDIVSRLCAERMSAQMQQSFVIDNKPGAGTNLGSEFVAKSAPDGYTLLMGTSSLAINPSLYGNLNYKPDVDLLPIASFAQTGYVLLVNPNTVAAKNLKDFVAFARERGDKLTFGSAGSGAVNHLAGELFNSLTGSKMRHIPYRGSQAALVDLMGGRIDAFFASTLESLPLMKDDKVRALGVTNTTRLKATGDLPAIAEAVKGYECLYWMGMFAPKGTPQPVIQTLANALQAVSKNAELRTQLIDRGAEAMFLNSEDTQKRLTSDTKKWGALVKSSGATAS